MYAGLRCDGERVRRPWAVARHVRGDDAPPARRRRRGRAGVHGTLPRGGGLDAKLTIAARLINANIGLRVLDVGLDGFDNHEQPAGAAPSCCSD